MEKIFIIEDDKTMQLLLKTLLEMEGFLVNIPDDFSEKSLLLNIQSYHPDFILMDVNLRHLSGLDLLKKIRSKKKYDNIKIIMSSGMSKESECLQSGADIFIQKPYAPSTLLEWLKSNGQGE